MDINNHTKKLILYLECTHALIPIEKKYLGPW